MFRPPLWAWKCCRLDSHLEQHLSDHTGLCTVHCTALLMDQLFSCNTYTSSLDSRQSKSTSGLIFAYSLSLHSHFLCIISVLSLRYCSTGRRSLWAEERYCVFYVNCAAARARLAALCWVGSPKMGGGRGRGHNTGRVGSPQWAKQEECAKTRLCVL